ncbi:diiron oxygenase [Saccharomonospora viridis]|uniref:diiron oxygenase n=1 Tax=Saccharomonospora viridis TaxID=1852 RepID=UPI00240A8EE5|nr:diiron oxygenase [Saccharomonospora viridis]
MTTVHDVARDGLRSLGPEYVARWEERGSIRTRPRKTIDFEQTGYFFPADRQPLLLDESVAALGEHIKERILIQSFFKYLHDIVNLEIKEIVSACTKLLYSDLPVEIGPELKLNTYSVIIDEYYHVYIAQDLILQLREHYPDLGHFEFPTSDSQRAVTEIKARLEPRYHDVFEILANCCFETTLVRELVEFFDSKDVHPSIRYYVKDHMNDESRHYAFFLDLMKHLWARMPEDYREAIGSRLGEFVKLYLSLESEKEFNVQLLESVLGDRDRAERSITRLYSGFDVTPDLPIAQNVLRAFGKAGLLEHPAVRSSFRKIGWEIE